MLRCNITLVEKKNSAVKWKDGSTQTAKWLDRNSRKIETHTGAVRSIRPNTQTQRTKAPPSDSIAAKALLDAPGDLNPERINDFSV